ncbi:MAG: hypothetical protein JWM95_4260 [Gemmatimonadetes bacterium]|nr:hypothetical protein [Gemmatimonadota bacterium]
MEFTLEIEFSGLCLYVLSKDGTKLGVAMPDCRRTGINVDHHLDGHTAVPHVGYMRYNLADVGVAVPPGDADNPEFEVVHRFGQEDIDFGMASADAVTVTSFVVPDLSVFAPGVTVRPGIFTAPTPPKVLMRTVLSGGTIKAGERDQSWRLSTLFGKAGDKPHTGKFNGTVLWSKTVQMAAPVGTFDVKLKPFDTTTAGSTITFQATNESTVRIKVANLCSDNPLEWDELFIRSFAGTFDEDFKWLYHLLEYPGTTFEKETKDRGLPLPAPELTGDIMGKIDDCTGAKITSFLV